MRFGLSKRNIVSYKYRGILYKIYFFIIFLMTFILLLICFFQVKKAFLNMFTPHAINIGSDAINFTVSDYFTKNKYDYSDFVTLMYNDKNEVTSVQTNSALMNKVKADISIYLQEEIINLKEESLNMPLGSAFGSILFHGIGPNIKISVKPTDITDLVFNDKFESVGINQVRHKIYIDAYVTISINCASMIKSEVIHDEIPVCETVIVGDVPTYYSENGDFQILQGERVE